jgi:two-component system response regulator PilR (NtrC family)
MCENGRIEVDDLRLPDTAPAGETATPTVATIQAAPAHPLKADTPSTPPGSEAPAGTPANLVDYIDNLERDAIVRALEECRYNKTKAAAKLGITFRALRYKLKKLGIE